MRSSPYLRRSRFRVITRTNCFYKTLSELFYTRPPAVSTGLVRFRSTIHVHAESTLRRPLNSWRSQLRKTNHSIPPASHANCTPFTFRRANSTTKPHSKELSFSQRMRKLSREYGWSALGVYLLLSALDFPFCFAAVRLLGVERIGHYEHMVVEGVKRILGPAWPWGRNGSETRDSSSEDLAVAGGIEGTPYDHGVVQAQKRNEEGASVWTQLALAYAIHKSFIFIRVPLTAAVTPKVVRVLRRWGWDIGSRRPRS
ncbi:hypothetical protein VTO42DRAFT_2766 [Malbranchea cinnamomea]